MPDPPRTTRVVRFGPYEADFTAAELRKNGRRVKLQERPFNILQILLERPGEVISREELRNRLWPANTFVDFDHSLNSSINKLRQALNDDVDSPRFVATVGRRGYRFIATVGCPDLQANSVSTGLAEIGHPQPSLGPPAPAAPAKVPDGSPSVDSPENSGHVETLPRVEYNFPAPTKELAEVGAPAPGTPTAAADAETPAKAPVSRHRGWLKPLGVSAVLITVAIGFIVWPRARVRSQRPGERVMLAVLPFENLTGDPGQEYFSDGLTEEMITELGSLQPERLGVIARTSVMRYKQGHKPLDQIGRELGVQYVLEGSVRRDGNRVRIAAQLIDAKDQTHLWARTYNGDLGDTLGVESEAAQDTANEIRAKLSLPRPSRLPSSRPANPEAYEAYLRGRFFWNKRTNDGFRAAIEYFQMAIAKDPNYALAYAGLADSYVLLGGYGFEGQRDAMSRAEAAAQKALAIDDRLAEAYTTLGLIAEQYHWNWSESEKDFKRAIELNPNYSVAHHWYGDGYLAAVGKTDEAIAELRKAHELDPLSLVIATDLAKRLCFAGNYEEGMEQFRKILEIDPNFVQAHYNLSLAYEQRGAFAEAIAEAKKIDSPDDIVYALRQLGLLYALHGKTNEAVEILDQLQRLSKKTYIDPACIANIYIALGDKNAAFIWLERAFEQHSPAMDGLKCDRFYDPIRSDPRFDSLIRRVGFP